MGISCACGNVFQDDGRPWQRCPVCCGLNYGASIHKGHLRLIEQLRDIGSAGILRFEDAGVMNACILLIEQGDNLKVDRDRLAAENADLKKKIQSLVEFGQQRTAIEASRPPMSVGKPCPKCGRIVE